MKKLKLRLMPFLLLAALSLTACDALRAGTPSAGSTAEDHIGADVVAAESRGQHDFRHRLQKKLLRLSQPDNGVRGA